MKNKARMRKGKAKANFSTRAFLGGLLLGFLLLGNITTVSADLTIYSPPKKADFCGEPVPLERIAVEELFEEAFLSVVYFHSRTIMWLKKANRFFPYVEKRLRERGMPDDLKYIMVAESSFRQDAVSSVRAVGFWQFMEATAKKRGLRVDRWLDERRNFERSTEAALNYLAELHSLFGSWTLAAAAYNCGENRVKEAIHEQGVSAYYDLKLPAETEMYIFRILAAKTVIANPVRYGYNLKKQNTYKIIPTSLSEIVLKDETPVVEIAARLRMTYKEIKDMNPDFRQSSLPPGSYLIKTPFRKATIRMP